MSTLNEGLAADLLRHASTAARDQVLNTLHPCSAEAMATLVEDLSGDVDLEVGAIQMDFPLEVECRAGCDACCH
ncbi:MAG: hypothetical protein KC619_35905, partial [Myxococcales bacterium]|nr:hypothetical protein [Myxococcales bacterium]